MLHRSRPSFSLFTAARARLLAAGLSAALLLLLLSHIFLMDSSLQQHSRASATARPDNQPQAASPSPQPPSAPPLPVDIWAAPGPVAPFSPASQSALRALLPPGNLQRLSRMCGRCLYRTLAKYVEVHGQDGPATVKTGDIAAMWTRDSAVQTGVYLPRIARRPWLRSVVEGAIRSLAFFILQDPWANAYTPTYLRPDSLPKTDRVLGRGAWVFTRNFELDSSAYFFNLLYNYAHTGGLWAPEQLLNRSLVHDAVVEMLRVLEGEQNHTRDSPYRYSELQQQGLGKPTSYTGLLWTGFRPSDDPVVHHFNIPDNMYLAAALERLGELDAVMWRDAYIGGTAARLAADIRRGIEAFGIVEVQDPGGGPPQRVYAYEVDGLGNHLLDFDDPNIPSLLAVPLLGYRHYDGQVYAATRARILSTRNPFYFVGSKLSGLGSPHTGQGFIWPLAHMAQALTTTNTTQQLHLLQDLLDMSSTGIPNESVHTDSLTTFTRAEFGWAQTMLVVSVEQLLGLDCDALAEEQRLQELEVLMNQTAAAFPTLMANGDQNRAYYYNLMSAQVGYKSGTP